MKSCSVLAVTALAAALSLAACDKTADKAAGKESADKSAVAEGAKDAKTIPGLKDEKAQASYVVGLTMGKQLADIKSDIELETVVRGLKDELSGGKKLVDDGQAREIMAGFMEKMQAKMMAEQMAKARKNTEEGQKFLAENGKKEGVKTTASGLQYQVVTEGKGAKPGEGDAVKVKYKGTLLDGTEFDSTEKQGGEPAVLPLDRVIPGWAEGIRLMPVGSKYKFWIPSNLGYGEQVPPGAPFPPNATLVFDVELLDIVKAPKH
ncbi:FKBP-type peptidyl-prolyl cis-trans isomerase [Lysobacter pythonis]|uniref:Peptidyl-prolyl cis-trans isomerase n=1 Tax=Solilutibacter pythonis TaxID=2483112 RepID=A0A3M2HYV5_9GAMM|nr:FKBP-type peptidyl-prolyl cis-trans isomerase [Lysobacter pythonis]RMH94921.1 FKBP-type peptidyl-prolyl cis-trans isomerase [Lysobacter pythonis]